ncbi:MAG: FeoB-associated Cys-rich membrane protein [Robiginitalea sp.]|nr:FeoB-associated Cys-rich membrane protein [Robiginitalea sp.]
MWSWQHILVYLTLALAVGYLLRKFVFTEVGKSKKESLGGGCGDSDCACH